MAIRLEQPGGAKAAAQAGTIIGKGKRAEEDRARAEREQARAAQEQARAAALQWEQEKMRMRSEQDFQQELAAKQWDYEKFNRAKAWQIEKMEIASRNDFAQEEKERSEKQAKTAAGVKAIRESTNIYSNQEAKDKAEFDFLFKQEHGYSPPRQTQGMTEREELEEYVGSYGREMDLPELREEAEVAGYTPKELGLGDADIPGIGMETKEAGLPTPTTQAEYNAIPSGSQYIDSKGNIRTKR